MFDVFFPLYFFCMWYWVFMRHSTSPFTQINKSAYKLLFYKLFFYQKKKLFWFSRTQCFLFFYFFFLSDSRIINSLVVCGFFFLFIILVQFHSHVHFVVIWFLSYLSVHFYQTIWIANWYTTKDTVVYSCSFLVWVDFARFALYYIFFLFFSCDKCLCYPTTHMYTHAVTSKIKKKRKSQSSHSMCIRTNILFIKSIQSRNNVQMIFAIHHKMSIKHSSYFKQSLTKFCHIFFFYEKIFSFFIKMFVDIFTGCFDRLFFGCNPMQQIPSKCSKNIRFDVKKSSFSSLLFFFLAFLSRFFSTECSHSMLRKI